ncbi:DUF2039 domain-containing protein [archaeon]|nr:MAG: DUF2039 domain-containing protein [archaeon]
MPGKYSDGFIKAAQKQKFVRHRDLKMKESELKRERHIQKVMCEGICRKCRDKVQWRFQFDKYKPLKNPGTCQECKQKTITKAYRTLCDGCAQTKNVCPSCCGDMVVLLAAEEAEKKKLAAKALKVAEAENAVGAPAEEPSATADPIKPSAIMEVEEHGDEDEEEEEEEEEEENEEEDIEHNGEDSNDHMGPAEESEEIAGLEEVDETSIPNSAVTSLQWNEQKFKNISASKYSKSRVPGQEI